MTIILQHFPAPIRITVAAGLTVTLTALPFASQPQPGDEQVIYASLIPSSGTVRGGQISASSAISATAIPSASVARGGRVTPDTAAIYGSRIASMTTFPSAVIQRLDPGTQTLFATAIQSSAQVFGGAASALVADIEAVRIESGTAARGGSITPLAVQLLSPVIGSASAAFGGTIEKLYTNGQLDFSYAQGSGMLLMLGMLTAPTPSALRTGATVGNGGGPGYTVQDLMLAYQNVAEGGRQPDYLLAFTGEASQSDFRGSIGYQNGNSSGSVAKAIIWSVPLLYGDKQLVDAQNGDLDADYTYAANALKDRPLDDEGEIKIRTGWEFNGDWMRWKTKLYGNDAYLDTQFIAAYRRFVNCFRAVSPNFRFIWNSNIEQKDPELAYPGNAYVDYITMDFYVQQSYDQVSGSTPATAAAWFDFMVNRPNGLSNLVAMGQKYGKPIGIDEWGVSDDVMAGVQMADYITLAFNYFKANNFHHAIWWDQEASYPSEIHGSNQPAITAAYQSAIAGL